MFSIFKREKWALVKTIVGAGLTYAAGTPNEMTNGKVYVHLYESSKGNRRIETACSFVGISQEKIDEYVKSTDTYQTKLIRWLSGRYDPEIPRYSETDVEDTANALRGKVE